MRPGRLLAEEAHILQELIEDGRGAYADRRLPVCRADLNLLDRKTPELPVVVHLPSISQTISPGRQPARDGRG